MAETQMEKFKHIGALTAILEEWDAQALIDYFAKNAAAEAEVDLWVNHHYMTQQDDARSFLRLLLNLSDAYMMYVPDADESGAAAVRISVFYAAVEHKAFRSLALRSAWRILKEKGLWTSKGTVLLDLLRAMRP